MPDYSFFEEEIQFSLKTATEVMSDGAYFAQMDVHTLYLLQIKSGTCITPTLLVQRINA